MKPISIAIDGNEANVSNRVGSNVYAFEIISQLELLTRNDPGISWTVLLAHPHHEDLPTPRKGWSYKVIGPKPLWTQIALPCHLYWHKNDYSVLFTPGHYAPRLSSIPYISSVMDLAFLKFPNQFKTSDLIQLKNWTAYSVRKAAKVIAISEFTKQAVIEEYHKPAKDITVAYPAVTTKHQTILLSRERSTLKKLGIKGPYFLYVGTLQPRKNLVRLIEAFEKFSFSNTANTKRSNRHRTSQKNSADVTLVIAGRVGWLAQNVINRIESSPLRDLIITTGYVDESTKQILYSKSLATLLVGLYEGFGIPPLEAMSYGSIPIVSNSSSLPEVVGSAGILVNPESSDEICEALQKVIQLSPKQRAIFQRLGRQQVTRFSWEKSAQEVLATLLETALAQSSKDA